MRRSRSAVRSLLAAAALLAAACSDSTGPLVGVDDVLYAPALGVDLDASMRTASGLAYQDLVVGTGALAQPGTAASVRYTGWRADGTQFDSNVAAASPLVLAIGDAPTGLRTVPGFEEGVSGMRVGGRRKLIIPPALGYGRQGSGPVPGNTVIVFDVELVSVP